MNKIPTRFENPEGLHQRYVIKKLIKDRKVLSSIDGEPSLYEDREIELQPDEGSEYFVMRLDEGGSDREHIAACRIGVHAYAEAIEHHLPQLAKDLKERYPLLTD